MQGLTPTFCSNQTLNGHGVFRHHLKSRHPRVRVGVSVTYAAQTPDHVFLDCPRPINGGPFDWDDMNIHQIWQIW